MRLLKQLAYGLLYFFIFSVLGSVIYGGYFYETPTCFDDIQNQEELGIDCDGECIACELKNATLRTSEVNILQAGEGKITLVTKIDNPVNYGAVFEYKIDVIGKFGNLLQRIDGESSANPRSSRHIVVPGLQFDIDDTSRAFVETNNVKWSEGEGEELLIVEIIGAATSINENDIRVTGGALNRSIDLIKRARITALLVDEEGYTVSASAVDVINIGVSEEKSFTIFFPKLEDTEPASGQIHTEIFGEVMPGS